MGKAIERVMTAIGIALAAAQGPLAAQRATGFSDSVTVVPGAQYAKGGVYEFFFGEHYRDLWTTPIRVPVLDLKTFAGGLTPGKLGGGQQTKSIRLKGADGRQYVFRSVAKDPSSALPEALRETFADRIFEDQISAGHPVGALVVPPILRAAGVLHAPPILAVMPDDPALGEARAEFANVLGTLEERPRDSKDEEVSFAGAKDVVSTEDLRTRLDGDPAVRVDSREFLVARLIDVFLGDWDRHQDQWRWALIESAGKPRWLPIPRDRDQVLARFDGFLLGIARLEAPQLVNFGPGYPPIVGATWNGRDLDRRLLTDLERPVWDSVAEVLRARLTDSVLAEAVAALPPEYQAIDAARLEAGLRARRDGIPAMADAFYRHLAREVDVHGSHEAEIAAVERIDDRNVEVSLRPAAGGKPFYRRRFVAGETSEIRIYLLGGADSAAVTGTGSVGTTIRVIGGPGEDRFGNQAGGGPVRYYDVDETTRAVGGPLNRKPYQAIADTTDPTSLPHRDWGSKSLSFPFAAIRPDAGFLLGWGGRRTTWAFRKKPYSSRLEYSGMIATGAETGRVHLTGQFFRENSRRYLAFDVLASGIEVLRWHGFGNQTEVASNAASSFYRVTHGQLSLTTSLGWTIGDRTRFEIGPTIGYTFTDLDSDPNDGRFIGVDRPFGTDGFGQAGGRFSLIHDSRDIPRAPGRGVLVEVGGSAFPKLLDVEEPFGEIHGRVATYLSARIPTSPTLALQLGGKKVFGTAGRIPFHQAAFLGDVGTLRGFRSQRFAGDGSLYGSAELRLHLTNLFLLVPGTQGVFGFYDRGRVYLEGERSDRWHDGVGGGIWLAFLTPGSLITLSVGNSDEGTRFYGGLGFAF